MIIVPPINRLIVVPPVQRTIVVPKEDRAMLARKTHTAGNKIEHTLDYSQWLPDGAHVATATVTLVDPAPDDVQITNSRVGQSGLVYFFLGGGAVKESFTVQVSITDSIGEIKNDQIGFEVVAP
jgi:hypothetical protein